MVAGRGIERNVISFNATITACARARHWQVWAGIWGMSCVDVLPYGMWHERTPQKKPRSISDLKFHHSSIIYSIYSFMIIIYTIYNY